MTVDQRFPFKAASYLYNAAHCSDVAVAAYYDEDHALIKHWPNRRMFQVGDDQGVVVWNDTDIVIGVAGSNDVYDMIKNFDCRVRSYGAYTIHAGFFSGAQVVASALLNLDIPAFDDPAFTWWGCGHSRGAAEITLLPLLIHKFSPTRIFTFASPRCLRSDSVALYDYPVFRIDHPYDVVPDVPFSNSLGLFKRLGGWSHVGQSTYIWRNGAIDTENGYWMKRVAKHVWDAKSLRPDKALLAAIPDHSMDLVYSKALSKWKSIPYLVKYPEV